MKFQHTKHGIKSDPRGAHVTLDYRGHQLLGEVIRGEYDSVCGCIRLEVRHLNGEMWPISPSSYAVDVLERRPS